MNKEELKEGIYIKFTDEFSERLNLSKDRLNYREDVKRLLTKQGLKIKNFNFLVFNNEVEITFDDDTKGIYNLKTLEESHYYENLDRW